MEDEKVPVEIILKLICEDYLYNQLKPLIQKEGRDIAIDKLQMRSKFKRSYCEQVVDYLSKS